MAAWIIQNRIDAPEDLTGFNLDGYEYQPDESTDSKLTFSRPQPPPVGKITSTFLRLIHTFFSF